MVHPPSDFLSATDRHVAHLTRHFLELKSCRVEGVPQRDVDVLVVIPICNNFPAWQPQIDADAELATLPMVFSKFLHGDPATDDAGMEFLEFFRLLPDMLVERIGTGNVSKGDLDGDLHA